MAARKKTTKQDTGTALQNALAAFEKSEGPFYEGMKLLKESKKDFAICAKNKNLYSHALRALRHISKQPCESADIQPTYRDCEAAIAAGAAVAGERCWPCFARDALRQAGDRQ